MDVSEAFAEADRGFWNFVRFMRTHAPLTLPMAECRRRIIASERAQPRQTIVDRNRLCRENKSSSGAVPAVCDPFLWNDSAMWDVMRAWPEWSET